MSLFIMTCKKKFQSGIAASLFKLQPEKEAIKACKAQDDEHLKETLNLHSNIIVNQHKG